jgi:hypothetical protein
MAQNTQQRQKQVTAQTTKKMNITDPTKQAKKKNKWCEFIPK